MNGTKQKKIINACKDIVLPGSNDVMPIAGYYGPHRPVVVYGKGFPDYVKDETFKMIS